MTLQQASALYGVSVSTVSGWRNRGVDLDDASAVVAFIRTLRRLPASWQTALAGLDDEAESMDTLKRRKLKWEAERQRLAAEKEQGKLVPLAEAEAISIMWTDALKSALAATAAELAQHLPGLDSAEIEARLSAAHRDLLAQLSDLESDAWKRSMEKSADETTGKKLVRVGS